MLCHRSQGNLVIETLNAHVSIQWLYWINLLSRSSSHFLSIEHVPVHPFERVDENSF